MLELDQLVIFVKFVQGCVTLSQLLIEQDLSAIVIHRVKMVLEVIKQKEKEADIVKDSSLNKYNANHYAFCVFIKDNTKEFYL